jgi:hypothetical protein
MKSLSLPSNIQKALTTICLNIFLEYHRHVVWCSETIENRKNVHGKLPCRLLGLSMANFLALPFGVFLRHTYRFKRILYLSSLLL